MSLAFFDLDKTLIADNSARLWILEEWHQRRISIFELFWGSFWLLKYTLGFTRLEEVIKISVKTLKGKKSQDFLDLTIDFYERMIKDLYRPGALKAILWHKSQGEKTVLLTSAIDFLSELVMKDLGLDFCLSSKLEIGEKGLFTGSLVGEPCFGVHKVTKALDLAKKLGVSLKDCTFYTDSASDLPLLNIIGKPKVVNPDIHLWTRARLKRWPIIDWGRP